MGGEWRGDRQRSVRTLKTAHVEWIHNAKAEDLHHGCEVAGRANIKMSFPSYHPTDLIETSVKLNSA